jgi:hypothetical protein
MSISYQPSDSAVQAAALKWQTLVLKKQDSQIVTSFDDSGAGGTGAIVVDIKQAVAQSASSGAANYIPGCQPVMQVLTAAGALRVLSAGPSVSGTTITATATSLAPTDAIVVHYVINES